MKDLEVQESVKNYLMWLQERGLDDFLPITIDRSSDADSLTSDKQSFDLFLGSAPKLVIVAQCSKPKLSALPDDEKLLLGKLIKAIGMTFNDIVLFAVEGTAESDLIAAIREAQAQHLIDNTVYLGNSINELDLGILKSCPDGQYIVTYSPCDLLSHEELKRPTWEHLKKFTQTATTKTPS